MPRGITCQEKFKSIRKETEMTEMTEMTQKGSILNACDIVQNDGFQILVSSSETTTFY